MRNTALGRGGSGIGLDFTGDPAREDASEDARMAWWSESPVWEGLMTPSAGTTSYVSSRQLGVGRTEARVESGPVRFGRSCCVDFDVDGILQVVVAGGGGSDETVEEDTFFSFTLYKDCGCRETIESTNVFCAGNSGFGFLMGTSAALVCSTALVGDVGLGGRGATCLTGDFGAGFVLVGDCLMGSTIGWLAVGGGNLTVLKPIKRGSRRVGTGSTGLGASAEGFVFRGRGGGGAAAFSVGSSTLDVDVASTGAVAFGLIDVGEAASGIDDLFLLGGRVFLGSGFIGCGGGVPVS